MTHEAPSRAALRMICPFCGNSHLKGAVGCAPYYRMRGQLKAAAEGSEVRRMEDFSCQLPLRAHLKGLVLLDVAFDDSNTSFMLFDGRGSLIREWPASYDPSLSELEEIA